MAAHANAGVKSVVCPAGTDTPITCCRLRKDPLDFGKVDTGYKQLSHEFAVPAALLVADGIVKRGIGRREQGEKFQVDLMIGLEGSWPIAAMSRSWGPAPSTICVDELQ